MLTPEQVLPFLMHEKAFVRNHALHYFTGASRIGELTADHYWEVIDQFGWKPSLSFCSALMDVPQTEHSYQRLMQTLQSRPDELFDFHLQHAAGAINLELVRRHLDILDSPLLLPHVREHLRQRLALLDDSPEVLWDRLMEHGRDLRGASANTFDHRIAGRLIEALARRPQGVEERALAVLNDLNAGEDWREIFAVQMLGAIRCETAIDPLIARLELDANVLCERTVDALVQIGTTEVVRRIVAFYPGKPWDVRLFAHSPLERIKLPQSEAGLLALLEIEQRQNVEQGEESSEDEERLEDQLLAGLCLLGSMAGLDRARALIHEDPSDPEIQQLRECQLATSIMTGTELVESAQWTRQVEREFARQAKISTAFSELRNNWRARGAQFEPDAFESDVFEPEFFDPEHSGAGDDDVSWEDIDWPGSFRHESTEPYRREAPKIGRNDPCPCGSGKKYKKCCGK
jgi:hypothetical protein